MEVHVQQQVVELFKLNYLLWYSYKIKYDINRQSPCAIFLFIIFSSFKFFKNAFLIKCFTLTSDLHIFTYQQGCWGKNTNSIISMNFSDCSVVNNLSVNARDSCSIPRQRRSPGEGNDNPPQYFCWGFHGQRKLMGYSPWGHRVRHSLATK